MVSAPIIVETATRARRLAVAGGSLPNCPAMISTSFRKPAVAAARVCSSLRVSSLPIAASTHQVVEPGRDDPMRAELSAGRRDDSFAGLRRFLSRLPHDVAVAPGQKYFGFQLTSKIASLTIWMSI